MGDKNVVLRHSRREPLHDAREVGPVAATTSLAVTLCLRSRASLHRDSGRRRRQPPSISSRVGHLAPAEFERKFGANPKDIARVVTFAHRHGLVPVRADLVRRTVWLRGSAAAMSAAFSVDLKRYQHPSGSYHGHAGLVRIPASLSGIVVAVLGLDDRPMTRRSAQVTRPLKSRRAGAATVRSYTPLDIARLYKYPAGVDGRGQCIGIIALGGGYELRDLRAYFSELNLALPRLSTVSVHHARNRPRGRSASFDGEVVGDIEIAGAVAPGARIVVYFAPNTERGFFDAISTAVHDRRHNPSVISVSWGALEDEWPRPTMSAIDNVFRDAVHLGVTVCCSSGDDGSSGGAADGAPHVYFPASSPHVLACGGTRLLASDNRITKESVWNNAHGASGGGVSVSFPLPAWQGSANVPRARNRARFRGRGVPDVAGNADPLTGYFLLLSGKQSVTGGTSAVAPLWAGLIARLNQTLGRAVGFLNPFLYGERARLSRSGALRGVTKGSNGSYRARKGWNPCAGLGTPDGTKLLVALSAGSRK